MALHLWKERSYEFKGAIIGLSTAIVSVVIMYVANILPSNYLRILEPHKYATFKSAFLTLMPYYVMMTLAGMLIGFIIGRHKKNKKNSSS